jgi:hypothetical protein
MRCGPDAAGPWFKKAFGSRRAGKASFESLELLPADAKVDPEAKMSVEVDPVLEAGESFFFTGKDSPSSPTQLNQPPPPPAPAAVATHVVTMTVSLPLSKASFTPDKQTLFKVSIAKAAVSKVFTMSDFL